MGTDRESLIQAKGCKKSKAQKKKKFFLYCCHIEWEVVNRKKCIDLSLHPANLHFRKETLE